MSLNFWKVGESYFVRTVTMYCIGRLLDFSDKELLFENASWIADCGRFNEALKTGSLDEVEPFINSVLITREAIIDATTWTHELPSKVI